MASTATKFDTDCKLMLHMDGSDASTTFTDSSSSPHTMTANGNAQIDTAQSKFGGASGLFDGSGDYLSTASSSDFDFGSGNWTVDFLIRLSNKTTTYYPIGKFLASTGWMIAIAPDDGTRTIRLYSDATSVAVSTDNWNTDQWYHVAVVRSGSGILFFKDGVQQGATQTATSTYNGASTILHIGYDNSSVYFPGWLDEIRVVKGTAIWTGNFTPPTSAYARKGNNNQVIWVD